MVISFIVILGPPSYAQHNMEWGIVFTLSVPLSRCLSHANIGSL